MRLRIWPALYVPPLVFLALQSLNYALEPLACENQQRLPMHLTAAVALLVALGGVALALRAWRSIGGGMPHDEPAPEERARFVALLALMLSTLSTLAIAMLWVVQILMPACIR
jgi:hypothetical protein